MLRHARLIRRGGDGTDGEVANALVCKTSIHGFKSHSVLHNFNNLREIQQGLNTTKHH
jgi:hypothetical protein